ncbi:glutamine-hydrolyzing carbamoyl-phosphate synthase small subunit [Weeksella virosa]|uniref:Carbamoyl phosphate synthase small chain n=1 Tax=Weeksella virosa (strain ATCC 43766 / DSM 16922 / JCM 21250 / CCUG 30538 / CDC 9751 / IAM 14551 / NBRC 16016 / NCTC 11634 / CL345/78) TaxID=865938 RepID=F0NY31_WEEVC|nr:glutamine-hydrolyzing carbamoyl-phosphate synthase small subunit [Weeksella virosa]ADX67022.1 carbamoyl-phosphate synthase, small subunit [Weeksella virosa DSM 16922]VEH63248.1 Carbamoyl-phosphate synthase small chain [Weeksella virosa]
MDKKVKIVFQDGLEIEGQSFGAYTSTAGEIVFNTAMVGYNESLTDPSYKGQIMVMTFPIVGNYGVPDDKKMIDEIEAWLESNTIQVSGLVVSYYSDDYSHWNAIQKLGDWLKAHNIPGVYGIDTRAITKKLREEGSTLAKIVADTEIDFYDPNTDNLVDQVSIKEVKRYNEGAEYKVVLVDCGVKNNIIRSLVHRGVEVIRVPWDYDYTILEYDGLFISNGPGDPKMCTPTIENIKKSLQEEQPIFGICLGNQLVSLAAGASTYKLKYGHRSHNQPVQLVGTTKCFITSQNHGFAVDDTQLPTGFKTFFTNLNDGTCEGIRHESKPIFTVQFHPEAMGGPVDTEYLFDEFIEEIKKYKNAKSE